MKWMTSNKECYKQTKVLQEHTSKNEDDFQQYLFVLNSNNYKYEVHSQLCFLKMFKPI